MSDQPQPQPETFYDRVGGHETFVRLVRRFYEGVAQDPPLKALYPEEDLGPAEVRLRMRHVPYKVTPDQRDRWLRHMLAAVDTISDRMSPEDEQFMRTYMLNAAHSLVNALED